MIISLDNLKSGLNWWHYNNWPGDILNNFYYNIYDTRSQGLVNEWWKATIDRLSQWRAYRGSKPPNTKADIATRCEHVADSIKYQYVRLIKRTAEEPSIDVLCWEEVATLFQLASEIKNSSVFASKMCHFIFPKLYIVMDNRATSVLDYEFYWRGMKDEWNRFKAKSEAKNLLIESMKSERVIHPKYPIETKLMELSHIGYKHK